MAAPAPAIAARRAAALVVARWSLKPPVDVEALLRERAELSRHAWPHDGVDAVLMGLASGATPLAVHIRATGNPLRERFTMAHELGHLLLPWHLPAANCEVGEGDLTLAGFTTEQEADVFASCVLVPDIWLKKLLQKHADDMSQLLRELDTAGVTTVAALHALRRFLLAGWVFVGYRGDLVMATRGTQVPEFSPQASVGLLRRHSVDHGEALLNGHPVQWFRMFESAPLPILLPADNRSDHQILIDAIASREPEYDTQLKIAQSANGKVGGGLRDAAGRPAEETFQAMRHRLEDWDHKALLSDPDFSLWLAQRARAIQNGTTKRQGRR